MQIGYLLNNKIKVTGQVYTTCKYKYSVGNVDRSCVGVGACAHAPRSFPLEPGARRLPAPARHGHRAQDTVQPEPNT